MTGRHQGGRKGPFRQLERHQGGGKGFIRRRGGKKGSLGQPARHLGGRKEPLGQPGRHQGGRKGSIGQPAKHQGGTGEAGKNHLDSVGGTREACSTGLPIESRFWTGAGFCITFNTISLAIGPVRGKSWGGLHGWLPVALARHQGGRKGSSEAPGRPERANWTACEAPGGL